MNEQQKWFAACLLMESLVDSGPPKEKLFEETIVLVRAATDADAAQKAERFGRDAEHEYQNTYGETVRWVFRELLDLKELIDEAIGDGTEVYYAFLDENEVVQRQRMLRSSGIGDLRQALLAASAEIDARQVGDDEVVHADLRTRFAGRVSPELLEELDRE